MRLTNNMLDNEVTLNAIKETVKEIALIIGGANLILVALITYLGKLWIDRLLESERRKTQIIVEQLKNSLTQEREKLNQVLKTQLDQNRYFFEQSIAYFSNNQKALSDKRFSAFEKLWKTIYELKKIAPLYLDVIDEDEYKTLRTNRVFKSHINSINLQELINQYQTDSSDFEVLRIYIPPIIWQLYFSYRMVVLRSQFLLNMVVNSSSTDDIKPWYFDPTLRNLIESLLDDEEIEKFKVLRIGQMGWILERLEAKILTILQSYISGDIGLQEMSEKSLLLDKANRKIQEITDEDIREKAIHEN